MNKQKKQKEIITVNLDLEVWKELQMLKINGRYRSVSDVVRVLMGEKK